MYFPDSIPTTAVKHLMGWIKRCTPLMGELQAMGYHTSNKRRNQELTSIIVRVTMRDCITLQKKSNEPQAIVNPRSG